MQAIKHSAADRTITFSREGYSIFRSISNTHNLLDKSLLILQTRSIRAYIYDLLDVIAGN
jgi:hypothetical protein